MGRSTPIRKKFAIIGAGQQASRNREETKNYPVDLLLCFCLIIFWTAGGSPPAHVGGALWSCPPREKRTKPRGTRAAGWRRPPLRRSANDKVSSARSDPPPIPVRRSTFSDPPFHPLGPPFHPFWSAVPPPGVAVRRSTPLVRRSPPSVCRFCPLRLACRIVGLKRATQMSRCPTSQVAVRAVRPVPWGPLVLLRCEWPVFIWLPRSASEIRSCFCVHEHRRWPSGVFMNNAPLGRSVFPTADRPNDQGICR